MKLRTKLLAAVLAYFFIYALFVFTIPTFVVVSDIAKVADRMHQLIVEKHRRLVRDQEVLIEDIFQRIRTTINATLFMVFDSKSLSADIVDSTKQLGIWESMIHIASFNPDIGFVQVDGERNDQAAVLTPAEANLYRLKSAQIEKGIIALLVENVVEGKREVKEELYLGLQLPQDFQNEKAVTYYAIISWDEALREFKEIKQEIIQAEQHLAQYSHLDVGQVFLSPQDQVTSAMNWIEKTELIRLLTPLAVEGVTLYGDRNWVPEGIARVDQEGEGNALFAAEIFRQKSIAKPARFFERNKPPAYAPPLAEGNFFIHDRGLRHVYLANTLDLGKVYVTLGSPIDTIAKQFAVWARKPVIITVGDEVWMGFDAKGELYPPQALDALSERKDLEKQSGVFEYEGKRFFFANIAEFEGGRIGIYELSQLDSRDSIAALSLSVARHLAWKISAQLFLISLVIIALLLFIASRVALRIAIKPITQLAEATEQVVAGQYESISWPEMGKRKDEVAHLTHSFEEMVQGLREKEKIRGVLDKVVSKDVANEILKSQIHLGGEDRIVSVLFGDIRGFTNMTEHMTPQKTIEILNACMTKISQVVEGEGGVIDKFVGDAIMAIYGAPTSCEDHALRAVSAGVLVLQALKSWNDEREAAGEGRVEMGIGVNTGEVVAGNMGAIDRLNYTVLGKNVNIASRLCSVAKPRQLVISEQTLNAPGVKESFYVEPLPSVMLKGFSEPFHIFHVIDFKWQK